MAEARIRAGKLRHRLAIQTFSDTRDSYGHKDKTDDDNWTTAATVWGSIEPLVGREYTEAQQTQADVSHRVRIRYRAGMTPKMRIVFNSRIFHIESVLDIQERRHETVMMCREEV